MHFRLSLVFALTLASARVLGGCGSASTVPPAANAPPDAGMADANVPANADAGDASSLVDGGPPPPPRRDTGWFKAAPTWADDPQLFPDRLEWAVTATDASGRLWVASWYEGAVPFGGSGTSACVDIFVANFESDGTLRWVVPGHTECGAAASAPPIVTSMAIDSAGNVIVGGITKRAKHDLDKNAPTGADITNDSAFLAKIGGEGQIAWTYSYPNATFKQLFVDTSGSMTIAGECRDGCELGTGQVWPSSDYFDVILRVGADGRTTFRRLGNGGDGERLAIAPGPNGGVIAFIEGLETGFPVHPTGAEQDKHGFLASLDSTGTTLWQKRFGNTGPACFVGTDPSGAITLQGLFGGTTVDFGGGSIASATAQLYVVHFSASGDFVDGKSIGGPVTLNPEVGEAPLVAVAGGPKGWTFGGNITFDMTSFGHSLAAPSTVSSGFFVTVDATGTQFVAGEGFGASNGAVRTFSVSSTPAGGAFVVGQYCGGLTIDGESHAAAPCAAWTNPSQPAPAMTGPLFVAKIKAASAP